MKQFEYKFDSFGYYDKPEINKCFKERSKEGFRLVFQQVHQTTFMCAWAKEVEPESRATSEERRLEPEL